ncbi:hypothetical protein TNCV_35611 [Trichonephila clavipes]|nr:hypothetical protein TNCV_35611 [Trichonephila clavipes]
MATSTNTLPHLEIEANPASVCRNNSVKHPEKLTVWCALWAGGIASSKNDEGHNVTVNGDCGAEPCLPNFSFLN